MIDQAEALRLLVRDRLMCCGPVDRLKNVYTVAITSGKGGVGKTSLAVNLALLMARSGRNVRLVDADFGLSNAEVLLGVKPRYTLDDVLRGLVDIRDAWTQVPGGVRLLSSGSGIEDMANLDGSTGVALVENVLASASDGDVIVIDTAPGINESVISLLTAADEVMIITSPEPTSITDAYAAMKVLISRSPDINMTLIANSCASPAQASAVADSLDSVCRRFLKRSFQRYEYLPADNAVSRAVRSQKPVVTQRGNSVIEPWLRKIAIRLEERIHLNAAEPAVILSPSKDERRSGLRPLPVEA